MNALVENSTLTKADFANVLEDVNSIRLAIGIGEGKIPELPKGKPGDIEQCVLARALSNGWEAHVEDTIELTNYDSDVLKDFNSVKAIETLTKKGLSAFYDDVRYYDENDGYVWESGTVVIELTENMARLISDFDNALIPSLISED